MKRAASTSVASRLCGATHAEAEPRARGAHLPSWQLCSCLSVATPVVRFDGSPLGPADRRQTVEALEAILSNGCTARMAGDDGIGPEPPVTDPLTEWHSCGRLPQLPGQAVRAYLMHAKPMGLSRGAR